MSISVTRGEGVRRRAEDGRVRALRWDVIPSALVLDMDLAHATLHAADGSSLVRVARAWLVIEEARGLEMKIDWGEFRGGFSVMEVRAEAEEAGVAYAVLTDFPRGELRVRGAGMMLLVGQSVSQPANELDFASRDALSPTRAMLDKYMTQGPERAS